MSMSESMASQANIPLKKRKFPMYQPPSPPHETPSVQVKIQPPSASPETPSVLVKPRTPSPPPKTSPPETSSRPVNRRTPSPPPETSSGPLKQQTPSPLPETSSGHVKCQTPSPPPETSSGPGKGQPPSSLPETSSGPGKGQTPSPPPETSSGSVERQTQSPPPETPSGQVKRSPSPPPETPSGPVKRTPSPPPETPSGPVKRTPSPLPETPSGPVKRTPSPLPETPSMPVKFRTPSPPPETPSLETPSVPVKLEPQLKEQSNLKPKSSPSTAGSPKGISGLATTSQKENSEIPGDRNVKPVFQLNQQSNMKHEFSPSNAGNPNEVSGLGSSSPKENSEHPEHINVNLVQGNANIPALAMPSRSRSEEVSGLDSFSQKENSEHPDHINVNLVQGNATIAALTMPSRSRSEMNGKGKLVPLDKPAFKPSSGNTVLKLTPNNVLPLQVKQELRNEGEVLRNDASSVSEKPVTTDLQLAEKKHLVPVVSSQDSRGICEYDKLDPCSWNLALAEGHSSSQINGNITKSKVERTHHSNRSLWDLNKMMDSWDGSLNDSATVSGIGGRDGPNASGQRDMQAMIYPTKMTFSKPADALVASGKQVIEKSECSTKLSNLSISLEQPQKTDDLLHLRLTTPTLDIPRRLVSPSSNLASVASRSVKSEPSDMSNRTRPEPSNASNRNGSEGTKGSTLKPVEHRIVKSEPREGHLQESNKSSSIGNQELVDHGDVKLEPVCRADKKTNRPIEGNPIQSSFNTSITETPSPSFNTTTAETALCSGSVLPNLDCPTTSVSLCSGTVLPNLDCPTTVFCSGAEASSPSEISTCMMNMSSINRDVVQNAGEISGTAILPLVSESLAPDGNNESKVSDDVSCITRAEGFDVADPRKSSNKLHLDPNGNGMVAESDEEKLNLFDDLHDESSSDTDDDQDGSPAVGDVLDPKDEHHGSEDDDYEDGEVREPVLLSVTEGDGYPDTAEHGNSGMSDMDISDEETNASFGPSFDRDVTSSNFENNGAGMEDPGESKSFCGRECDNSLPIDKHISAACLQEPSAVGMLTTESEQGEPIAQRTHPDSTGIENSLDGSGKELVSNGEVCANQGTSAENHQINIESQPEFVIGSNPEESKTEPDVNGAEAARDVNCGGNRSRIINLARAFNEPSLGRTRSIPGRSLPSRVERERITDVVFNGDKLHLRGNRDESFIDGGHKYERHRFRDQPVGSNGPGFMHGRGRTDKQMDFTRGDWGSDRNFAGDGFNCRTDFRFSRPKATTKIMVARDVTHVGKRLSDELPNFRHPPARRRSPGSREGPVPHGVQMVRRPQRNISPDRCIGGDAPNVIGLRQEEKFVRGLPDDIIDPVFSRPQPRYQQVDSPFRHGERSFSPIQRRGPLRMPRIRSKSPGARPRSPGPWSSPRRRSPDGFDRPELIHRRSPQFYRVERVRSPRQRPCFAEDVAGRRPGSPPYMSRIPSDTREMDTREHDHQRPFLSNRSPSGRVLPRVTRRFNMIDPRERMVNDEFYAGPMHSGRFHELEGDEGADERRICGERRGPTRSFRPPYDAAEVENFQFDVDGGPRSYRFSPEDDAEFHERGNLRDREFERRVKTRPGNAPRTNRTIEEPEENFRQGEPGWHGGAAFEDASRVKRRRF